MVQNLLPTQKKLLTKFKVQLYSRHPSHRILKENLSLLPYRVLIRLGSTTESTPGRYLEINTVQSVKNSSSKLLMKRCFDKAGVKTAPWTLAKDLEAAIKNGKLKYPVVVKNFYGSRGQGNYKINSKTEWETWSKNRDLSSYLCENFLELSVEYRIHIAMGKCIYTCRKVLKNDTPKDKRWMRNDQTCNWILFENPLFNAPVNWDEIVTDCVRAAESCDLDICAVDVKVQSNKGDKTKKVDWAILETNSAPAMGKITAEKYLEYLPQIAKYKKENN